MPRIPAPVPTISTESNQNLAKEMSKSVFGFFGNPKELLEKIRDKVGDKISDASKEYLEPSQYESVLDIPCRLLDDPSSADAVRIGDYAMEKKAILIVNVASK